MNLNELIASLKNLADRDEEVTGLIQYLEDWKKNNKTVAELNRCIGKYRSYVFPNKHEKNLWKIESMLYNFQNEVIANSGGMTMNERLYLFSLFERFDACKNDRGKNIIYEKLLSAP
jgi:hypothetical protein